MRRRRGRLLPALSRPLRVARRRAHLDVLRPLAVQETDLLLTGKGNKSLKSFKEIYYKGRHSEKSE